MEVRVMEVGVMVVVISTRRTNAWQKGFKNIVYS